MKNNVIIRCGTNYITLAVFNDNGIFVDSLLLPIHHQNKGDEAWLQAFSSTLDKIPPNLREDTVLVIPPNNNIFIKYVDIPEVEQNKAKEALNFEFNRNFPGEPEEWVWDSYKFNKKNNGIFILAMQRVFAERLLDILLRKKIKFSYLCPEILLIQIALHKYTSNKENSIALHIGSEVSLLSISNNNTEYMRIIQLAFNWVNEQIANSQQISLQDAHRIRQEYIKKENTSFNGLSFIKYYIRQFAQKIQQELKRSELFFYRTFNQISTSRIILSGECSQIEDFVDIIRESNASVEISTVEKYTPQNVFHKSLSDDKRKILSKNMLTYLGASECITGNKTQFINLFSEDFKHQISFQRQHPSYMAVMIIIIFITILGLKLTKQKVNLLESQKLATEAKLRESVVDTQKYSETVSSEKRIRESIIQIKNSLYSQDDWITFFIHLQKSIKDLKFSWIDSLTWHNLSQDDKNNIVHINVKIFIENDEKQRAAAKDIENFISLIKKCELVTNVSNVVIVGTENSIMTFSFDTILDSNSKIFAQ